MMRITVSHKWRLNLKSPLFLLKPIASLWPLASLFLPLFVLHGLTTYGSPMLWYEKSTYYCTYFDAIGFITVEKNSYTKCPNFAYRQIRDLPTLKKLMEVAKNVPSTL